MALPTLTQLLLPSFSISTLIGIVMIVTGMFSNIVVSSISWIFEKISGGFITERSIRVTLFGGGIILVWLPSVVDDLLLSLEGRLIMVAIVTFIILIAIIFSGAGKDKEGKKLEF